MALVRAGAFDASVPLLGDGVRRTPASQLRLVMNLTVSRTVNRNVDLFFGVQNVFDTLYYVGTNPTTIGTPRLVNGGIRLSVGR